MKSFSLIALELVVYLLILRLSRKPQYTVLIKEIHMALPQIVLGQAAVFQAELQQNGTAVTLPPGSTWTWTTNDTTSGIVSTPSADTTQCTFTFPTTDASTTILVTASTTAPNGEKVSGQLSVPVVAGQGSFTVVITQLS